jgi:acetyl coenzyme A synthetase (ADP forming)-like protein
MSVAAHEASTGRASSHGRRPLDGVLNPKSIAVVGVTATPGTVPYDLLANILAGGYPGKVYPVAPGKQSVCGLPAYRYVIDIEDPIDLAVIVFPAEVVDRALEHCGRKGVKSAIVISAGFREVGPAGVERERRIQAICAEYGISLIGPNCLGAINTDPGVRLNASFARKMPHAGRIAFLSQSGALCAAVLDYAREKEIGFSKFVSFGNRAGVTEIDLLEHLREDDQTDVILLYLEELRDASRLVEVARRVTRGDGAKPVLAIKSGRTPQGADAAASHTGALASEDAICDAVFREAGIVRADSIEELFNAAVMVAYEPMPAGNRVAIVTNAGGPGVMATDAAVRIGLAVPRLAEPTTARLKAVLPATANTKNPVDVIGDARADRYTAALEAVLEDPGVDQALVILTPQSMTDIDGIAQAVCRIHDRAAKPIACAFMGACDVASGVRILQHAHIPHYILPEWACHAMACVQQIRAWREQPWDEPQPLPVDRAAARAVIDESEPGFLPEDQALEVLAAYGLPVPPYWLCETAADAVAFAGEIGYPVVLRLVSPQVVHKTEMKAVALNLSDAAAVRRAYDQMLAGIAGQVPGAEIRGVLVRRMIPAGHEVILGAKRDPAFGPTLMFGLGGIAVELFRDVTFGLAPIGRASAVRMLRRVKAFRLLDGFRGGPPADTAAIADCLIRVGQLVSDFDRIVEMDINPLIAGPATVGNAVADVRIKLSAVSYQLSAVSRGNERLKADC